MMTYKLYGFKDGDRDLAEKYARFRSSHSFRGDRLAGRAFRLVAVYTRRQKLRGWRLYAVGSRAMIDDVDLMKDEVEFYFRGKPEDRTRLTYMIGKYQIQDCLSWKGEI